MLPTPHDSILVPLAVTAGILFCASLAVGQYPTGKFGRLLINALIAYAAILIIACWWLYLP